MNLPLPRSPHVEKPNGDHNAGLWYDKFFNGWDEMLTRVSDGNKADWVNHSASECGAQSTLIEQCERLQNLVTVRGGQVLCFKTDGCFVTGLGREHPVGNGFAWHHTFGVPYLPGASLKGVLRSWAREQGVEKSLMARIFGSGDRHFAGVGSVIFFDAIPPKPVKLRADVMTPHYGPYYQDEHANIPPADWNNPVPIPFLVVDNAQLFVFALAPRRESYPQDTKDCETVTGWLDDALTWLGAGAKTAVGYGRFMLDRAATEAAAEGQRKVQQERERKVKLGKRLQNLSSLAQELEREIETAHLGTDKNAFCAPPRIEQWLDKLEARPEPDAVRRFSGLVEKHFPRLLENPNKTKGKRNERAFNDRQRHIAERLLTLNDKQL